MTLTTGAGLSPILVDDGYDQEVRWRPGERMHHLFEQVCDRLAAAGLQDRLAVSTGTQELTYAELDAQANRLARHLREVGVRPGDRVGLLFDRAVPAYFGMLAVLKAEAAYVPLDVGFPQDRIAYIAGDAQVGLVLTESHLGEHLAGLDVDVLNLDEAADRIAGQSPDRLDTPAGGLDPAAAPASGGDLAYIVYTSGSTGVPKGVAIEHPSICNFLRVADEVYGVTGTDRVYQGMTIAFDFSVEEIWVGWMAGATLVPKPGKAALVGEDLRDFLIERAVTALCCVPTLLATIEQDVPGLRFLLVSGEACPQDLIARWSRPQRRFLNVYGPTEATVTATWTVLEPDRPVTIGVPLPTYSVLVLDPERTAPLPRGEVGEIAIAGIALSPGYVNRPDQTAKAFVEDTLDVPNNPSGRLYRTGDLGRVNEDGEIEYLGRIDTQVKIRGYRIELTEIESVLLQLPGVSAAVVEPHTPEDGAVELVAYVVPRHDAPELEARGIVTQMRERLPAYMVPAYVEMLDVLPMLPSDKVDRKRLPGPTSGRVALESATYVPPVGPAEEAAAAALAQVLGLPRVSAAAHFFDELGASSILMASYCAQVRAVPGLEAVRMSDIYAHPTVSRLVAACERDEAEPVAPPVRAARPPRVSALRYSLCGLYQAAFMAAWAGGLAVLSVIALSWIAEPTSVGTTYVRSVVFASGLAVYMIFVPVLAKWVIIGRWTPREIPIWSAAYLRFWTVRMLLRVNPLALFTGSPLAVLYLRMLGAKIGRRAVILTPTLPVCTDLVTLGSDTVINRGAVLNAYRADAGVIRTGPITVGERAYVGYQTVLDIDTSMGDDAQLGHASSLLPGQHVPSGQRWHGVPGRPTHTDFRAAPSARPAWHRSFLFGAGQLLAMFFGLGPAVIVVLIHASDALEPALLGALLGTGASPWQQLSVVELMLLAGCVLFLVAIVTGQIAAFTVPRLLNLGIRPGVTYPLYGLRYILHRMVTLLTNIRFFNDLFGDSSYVTGYLSRLGYRLRPIAQTGSNFGMSVTHESPYLSRVGHGTVVSDGLHFATADYTSTTFRCGPASLGEDVFTGNTIVLPTGAALGDNLLLGTKVMVPIDGPPRTGVGLLGSPCFEIPLTVGDDEAVVVPYGSPRMRAGLRRKNRFNLRSMGLFLLVRMVLAAMMLLGAERAFELWAHTGAWGVVALSATVPWVVVTYFIAVERASILFRRLRPQHCSIYDPYFWRHERYWKLSVTTALAVFDGTPFKSWCLRALGIKVGRRLFDDGCGTVEKSMVEIGDYCTLNYQSILQCHSLENSVFKSDRIVVGDEVTVGVRGFVHYGTRIGDGALIDTDSFVMKGEQVPAGQHWQGNPAGPMASRR